MHEVSRRMADRPDQSCCQGYAWQSRNACPQSHSSYFYYQKGNRADEISSEQLRHFKGTVQADGYKVYDYFEAVPGIVATGCMAHIRRKFIEAQKSHSELAAKVLGDTLHIVYAGREHQKPRGFRGENPYAKV